MSMIIIKSRNEKSTEFAFKQTTECTRLSDVIHDWCYMKYMYTQTKLSLISRSLWSRVIQNPFMSVWLYLHFKKVRNVFLKQYWKTELHVFICQSLLHGFSHIVDCCSQLQSVYNTQYNKFQNHLQITVVICKWKFHIWVLLLIYLIS